MVENRCIYARATLKNTKDGVELINSFTLCVIGVEKHRGKKLILGFGGLTPKMGASPQILYLVCRGGQTSPYGEEIVSISANSAEIFDFE